MARVRGRVSRAARAARDRVGSVWSVSAVAALECPRSPWNGLPGYCRGCNVILEGRRTAWCANECHRAFELNHIWDEARKYVLSKARHTCERKGCKVKTDLQVNHIDPVVGQGYHPSCYHHLDNLEALCRPHHQLETNKQREHRQVHWTEDSLNGSVVLPNSDLGCDLRSDLIRRMLDRASGFPFLFTQEDFDSTGQYRRYRPNTKWPVVRQDLLTNFPEARLWSRDSQVWLPLARYLEGKLQCAGVKKNGERCQRYGDEKYCWQHPEPVKQEIKKAKPKRRKARGARA